MFRGLSDEPRRQTAVEASEIITKMTIDHPVKDWAKIMVHLDISSNYEKTFAAMWAIAF